MANPTASAKLLLEEAKKLRGYAATKSAEAETLRTNATIIDRDVADMIKRATDHETAAATLSE